MRSAAAPVLVAALAGLLLAGCGGDDDEPDVDTSTAVPEAVSGPFVCPGVPARGLELMTGRTELTAGNTEGELGSATTFRCSVRAGDEAVASVSAGDSNQLFAQSAAEYVRTVTANEQDAQPVTAQVAGSGVVAGSDAQSTFTWACAGGDVVRVTVDDPVQGRDAREDLTRYGRSLLPTACARS